MQITYSGQEKGMATIDAQDPRNQTPRARIAHVIQMNLDSPNKLCANFKHAFGALLAIDTKEFLDVSCSCSCPPRGSDAPIFAQQTCMPVANCTSADALGPAALSKMYASAEQHLIEGCTSSFCKQTIVWNFSHLACFLLGSCACTQPTA